LISVAVIATWMLLPSITLILFLIIASYHFGKEDTHFLIDDKSYFIQILYFCKGLLIILAPLYFHFQETIAIFKLLLIDNNKNEIKHNHLLINQEINLDERI
jgi:Brp/Blh family beta-carotene 15,15'-monooxygenase